MTTVNVNVEVDPELVRCFETEIWPEIQAARGMAMKLTRDAARADELLSDASVKAWDLIKSYRRQGQARGWVRTIVYSVFCTKYGKERRARERSVDIEVDVLPATLGLEAYFIEAEERSLSHESLYNALLILEQHRPHFAQVLRLHYGIEGDLPVDPNTGNVTCQTIADHLGIRFGTVLSRLHRGRDWLKALLDSGQLPKQITFNFDESVDAAAA